MHLILSNDSPGNTTISDSATDQVLYRSSKPSKRIINISKVLPNDSEHDHMRDRFAHLAQIEWHGPKTSIFRYRGNESFTKDFFKHEGKTMRCVLEPVKIAGYMHSKTIMKASIFHCI